MTPKLTEIEARVLGALLEKEVTTPDQYPLSLNSLMNACNQKSNREPIMSLSETEVQGALDLLKAKHWIMPISGQRAQKFRQRFCNTEFSDFQFSDQERAVICLLLLRGPQSSGELKTRSQRMADFKDVQSVEATLDVLASHELGPFTIQLAREAGKRDVRHMHLLTEDSDTLLESQAAASFRPSSSRDEISAQKKQYNVAELVERIEVLEQKVSALESKL